MIMKMKLAQRIALGYYRVKFRALSLISHRAAADSVFKLFCTPYSGKPRRKAPPVFSKGHAIHFFSDGFMVNGWHWKPEQPNGKKILIVHGFDSCSYKFDRYVVPLKRLGFEVYAFDAPGHGTSAGKRINALLYRDTILEAERVYGPFYGIMAHSLGGLSAALAFEHLPDQAQRRLVLIAPTTETTTAISNFFRFVPVPDKTKAAFHTLLEEVGRQPISYFSLRRIIHEIDAPVLWVHDKDDLVCPYEDTLPIQALQLPKVEFFITSGLGHSGIYRQNNVFRKIVGFFAGTAEAAPDDL